MGDGGGGIPSPMALSSLGGSSIFKIVICFVYIGRKVERRGGGAHAYMGKLITMYMANKLQARGRGSFQYRSSTLSRGGDGGGKTNS